MIVNHDYLMMIKDGEVAQFNMATCGGSYGELWNPCLHSLAFSLGCDFLSMIGSQPSKKAQFLKEQLYLQRVIYGHPHFFKFRKQWRSISFCMSSMYLLCARNDHFCREETALLRNPRCGHSHRGFRMIQLRSRQTEPWQYSVYTYTYRYVYIYVQIVHI